MSCPHCANDTIPDNRQPAGSNPSVTSPISADGTPVIGQRYEIPARQGKAVRLARGQHLRIVNTHGTQVCDMWAFNAADISEHLSMEHMRAWIDRINPLAGDTLVTNHRRPILQFTKDTSPGVHDSLIAPCDIHRYRNLGVTGCHDSCADNLRLSLQAIGLVSKEVPDSLNLWMNIPFDARGTIQWLPTVSRPGDTVEFQAEMDCVVVMSACPQDVVAINSRDPQPVHFEVMA
ncbi:MAG: hypothetical protein GAK30_02047 [Paracidovorax wautersii]|uniref:DUF1989 domain-containing protein n=1 Tax=Paracidovorax wautersii TaxID=1177982 RepID=A0A7V8FNQ7_9BURK|nr:MAG: hypothetical protein GAK30_02047 [Paracidovorax wautersii]